MKAWVVLKYWGARARATPLQSLRLWIQYPLARSAFRLPVLVPYSEIFF